MQPPRPASWRRSCSPTSSALVARWAATKPACCGCSMSIIRLIQQAVSAHHGHVIKTIGDAFLVDFPSVVHAVQCAQAIHAQLRTHNAEKEKAEQIHVRIGIHLGDIVQKDGDVFGDGVNIASRLQSLAEPDTICISQVVYEEVSQETRLGHSGLAGQAQAQEHCRAVSGLCAVARSTHRLAPDTASPTPEALPSVSPAYRLALAGLVLIVVTIIAVRSFSLFPLSPQSSALSPQAAPAALPLPDKPSIVVLPFANMSNDPEQDYFSDGITEDITTDSLQGSPASLSSPVTRPSPTKAKR